MTDNISAPLPAGENPAPRPAVESPSLWEAPPETPAHRAMMDSGRRHLLSAAVCGLSLAVLHCDAKTGINVPFFSLVWLACVIFSLKTMGLYTRSRVLPPAAGMLLLGISTAMTANYAVQFINRTGILILAAMLLLRSFCQTENWQFGKYFSSVFRLVFTALSRLPDPVRALLALRRGDGKRKNGKGRYVLLGLALSLPLCFVVLALLCSADGVFRMLVERAFSYDLEFEGDLATAIKSLWLFLLGFFGLFCTLAGQAQSPVDSAVRETKRHEPVTAITFVSVLTAIYLVFCAVQVMYLFTSFLNAVLVVFCSWKFRESRVLRVLLTLVCACTYVLIASSAYRMLLYVDVYGLTFLRLLVLWFLLVLVILMAGIVVSLYRPGWNLFRFTCCVCLSLWLVFSFAKPDRVAARYNLGRFGMTDDTVRLTLYELSLDAVPVLAGLDYDGIYAEEWRGYQAHTVPRAMDAHGVRGFNLAVWEAARSVENSD